MSHESNEELRDKLRRFIVEDRKKRRAYNRSGRASRRANCPIGLGIRRGQRNRGR